MSANETHLKPSHNVKTLTSIGQSIYSAPQITTANAFFVVNGVFLSFIKSILVSRVEWVHLMCLL